LTTHDSIQFIDFTIVDMTKHLLGLQSVDCSETVSKLGNRAPLCEGVTMEKPQVLSGRYLHRLEAGKVGANSLVPVLQERSIISNW